MFIVQTTVKQTKKQTNKFKIKDSDMVLPFLLPLKNILYFFTDYFLGQKFKNMDVMLCLVSMKALKSTSTGTDCKYFPFPPKKQC